MTALLMDKFDDASIDVTWVEVDDPGLLTMVEADDRLKFVIGAGDWGVCTLTQTGITGKGPIDLFFRVTLPSVHISESGVDCTITDANGSWARLNMDWYDYPVAYRYNIYTQVYNGLESEDSGSIDWFGADNNYIYYRVKWNSSGIRIFCANTLPKTQEDWIEVTPTLVNPVGPLTYPYELEFYGWNNQEAAGTEAGAVEFLWAWVEESADPPVIAQYQRLQGYPKVTHPLVFNRNTGEFEVMEQPRPAAPLPIIEGADVLAYDGSGNLSTITRTILGVTYVKTLTYTGGNLTGVSVWVEQ